MIAISNFEKQMMLVVEDSSAEVSKDDYYLNDKGQRRPVFIFNYWMPGVDLKHAVTEFYDHYPGLQYIKMLYYTVLLIMGNDINPQVSTEVLFCTCLSVISANLVAVVFGGIAAEMQKAVDNQKKMQSLCDYIYYSL